MIGLFLKQVAAEFSMYRQGRKEQGEPYDDRQRITFGGRQYVVVGPGRADLLHPSPEDAETWLRKLTGADLLFDPRGFTSKYSRLQVHRVHPSP